MKSLSTLARSVLLLAAGVFLALAVPASAAPQRGLGQGKPGGSPAQRRAERQARRQARQQNRAAAEQRGQAPGGSTMAPKPGGASGPNARAGTPRPLPGNANPAGPVGTAPPASSVQPGGSSGANARAGTPRAAGAGAAAQQAGNIPPGMMNRLQQMSPEERDRWLQNNKTFQSLPAEQQAAIRKNFKDWDKLPPEKKANYDRNADALAQMTPEQRNNLRTQVMPQWRTMTPDRRQEIKQRLNSLNGLSDAERNQKLNDPNFYQGLSPQEHNVLKQFGEYKLNPGPGSQ